MLNPKTVSAFEAVLVDPTKTKRMKYKECTEKIRRKILLTNKPV